MKRDEQKDWESFYKLLHSPLASKTEGLENFFTRVVKHETSVSSEKETTMTKKSIFGTYNEQIASKVNKYAPFADKAKLENKSSKVKRETFYITSVKRGASLGGEPQYLYNVRMEEASESYKDGDVNGPVDELTITLTKSDIRAKQVADLEAILESEEEFGPLELRRDGRVYLICEC